MYKQIIKLKKVTVGFCLFFALITCTSFTGKPRKYEIKTIVIDAGHGGHDTGCLGTTGKEKDIALEISLKLGKLIQDNFPDVKVIYTRKTDVFVELHERAEIANRNKADLFICIHANSGGAAYGTETFVLGLHRAEENLAVSRRENSAILMEKDYKTKYDGFDPNSAEANIIFRLYQSTYLQQSLLFASKVQDQLNDFAGRINRGVKQAGLLVLARTSMPGVLIETGFLTNKLEEKYLLSTRGQNQIAFSIYRAFKEYKIDMEETPAGDKADKTTMDGGMEVNKPANDSSSKQSQTPVKEDKKIAAVVSDNKKTDTVKAETPVIQNKINKDSTTKAIRNPQPDKQTEKNANTALSGNLQAKKTDENKPSDKPKDNPSTALSNEKNSKTNGSPEAREIFFTIQLGATEKVTPKERERYKKIENVQERIGDDGMTRFTAGIYMSLDKAIQAQGEMRGKGFKDAFVTAYQKNKRITIKEAMGLFKSN